MIKKKSKEARMIEKARNLPKGWEVEVRQRQAGASTNVFGTYYVAPSGQVFRSSAEAEMYLAEVGE